MIKYYEKKIDTLGLNNRAKRIVKNPEKTKCLYRES